MTTSERRGEVSVDADGQTLVTPPPSWGQQYSQIPIAVKGGGGGSRIKPAKASTPVSAVKPSDGEDDMSVSTVTASTPVMKQKRKNVKAPTGGEGGSSDAP